MTDALIASDVACAPGPVAGRVSQQGAEPDTPSVDRGRLGGRVDRGPTAFAVVADRVVADRPGEAAASGGNAASRRPASRHHPQG